MTEQIQPKRLRAGEPRHGCPACRQSWSRSNGCLLTAYDSEHLRVVVGAEGDRATEFGGLGPCGDCGAGVGWPHHVGCDLETCPRCGGQAISCACLDGLGDDD